MDKKQFTEWTARQLNARGMTQKQLALALNTSESHVSLVLSGNRSLTADFAISVANALNVDPADVLRTAGILPPMPPAPGSDTDNPDLAAAWGLLQKLTPAELDVVVRQLRGLTS